SRPHRPCSAYAGGRPGRTMRRATTPNGTRGLPVREASCYRAAGGDCPMANAASTIAPSRGVTEPVALVSRQRDYGYLVLQLALKDFKIRYTHSLLGYTWSVLNPLIFSTLYFLVFSVFIRFNIANYPGYLLLGIVLWNFFSEG